IGMVIGALIVVAAFAFTRSTAGDAKKAGANPDNKLIGTWKLISAKYEGKETKFPEELTMLKHVTPAHFMWAVYDKDGKVSAALGGPCTFKGDKYEETPEYGVGDVLAALQGKVQSFTWKI